MNKDIILAVDYHDENLEIRRFNCATGEERCENRPTTRAGILEVVDDAAAEAAAAGGQVVWIMESTTGWARVKDLIGSQAKMVLTNVLQMPLPPKAYRRKTDKIDTGRLLREYLNGSLPQAFQPSVWLRRVRRLADTRESLVRRQTALRNWMTRYLAHETWEDRRGLWSERGMRRLRQLAETSAGPDRVVLTVKQAELEHLEPLLKTVEQEMIAVYQQWPEAQAVDAIRGIGVISAVSILAHIGPISRFRCPEALIAFAGLSPGVHQSDGTTRTGRIGGGGTDTFLRHYLIEASVWARQIPRYRKTYERVEAKRGKKIARIVVARLILRSIYKMLRDGVAFNQAPAA
jgi:transposase